MGIVGQQRKVNANGHMDDKGNGNFIGFDIGVGAFHGNGVEGAHKAGTIGSRAGQCADQSNCCMLILYSVFIPSHQPDPADSCDGGFGCYHGGVALPAFCEEDIASLVVLHQCQCMVVLYGGINQRAIALGDVCEVCIMMSLLCRST